VAATNSSLDCRTPGLISPNFTGNFRTLYGKRSKEEEIILLGVIHWYLEDSWRVLVNLWLSEVELQKENRVLLDFVLKGKCFAMMWFTQRYHTREFYGNVKKTLVRLLENLQPILKAPTVPKKVQRKRGYQDHGSLRPAEKWLETHDWSLTELQNQIEAERKSLEDTTLFLEGWYS
jgi:hypothetical protein